MNMEDFNSVNGYIMAYQSLTPIPTMIRTLNRDLQTAEHLKPTSTNENQPYQQTGYLDT